MTTITYSRPLKTSDITISLVISFIIGATCLCLSAYRTYLTHKANYEANAQIAQNWAQEGGKENCDAIRTEYTASLNPSSHVAACRRCCSDDMASCIDYSIDRVFYARKEILKKYVESGCASDHDVHFEKTYAKDSLPYFPPRTPDPVSIDVSESLPIGAASFIIAFLASLSIFIIAREKHVGWRRAVIVASLILAGAGVLAWQESISIDLVDNILLWIWSSILLGGVMVISRRLIVWVHQGFIDHMPEEQPSRSIDPLPVKLAAETVSSSEISDEPQQVDTTLLHSMKTPSDIDSSKISDTRPDFAYRTVARIYDYAICLIAASIPALLIDMALPKESSVAGVLFLGIAGMISAALTFYFMEKWCVFKFGGSPGKLISGLRIKTKDGSALSLKASGDRSLAVLSRGAIFMLGAPKLTILVNLIYWIRGKRAWEENSEVVFINEGVSQLRMVFLGILAAVLLVLILALGDIHKISNKQLIEESVIVE